jgi:tripartite-type tricarboxylate transporter receptor subunit TctC
MKRNILCGLQVLSLVALAGFVALARAQSYPTKPVRIVVAFSPGGASDVIARLVGAKLSERWTQQVVVDNRPGAGGGIGAEYVARSAPDGYTLLLGTSSEVVINPALNSKVGYDSARDFSPVAMIASIPLVLAVHPSMPVKSLKDFIALAKRHPKEINYASSGTGTATHLGMEMLKSRAAIDIVHIPYKGGPPGAADLIAGQVQAILATPSAVLPFATGGRMRVLAITAARRSARLPDVPTVAESGYPGFDVLLWSGVLAPAGTPRDIVTRLHAEVVKILALNDIRENLARQGADLDIKSPEEFSAYIVAELAKWAKVVKDSGARLE